MKKILGLLFILTMCFMPVFADDYESESSSVSDYLGRENNVFDNPFGGQKMYTDDDFQKALEEKKAQMKKKRGKKIKGNANSDTPDNEQIDETAEKCIILLLPVNLINGDGTFIPTGHYKIVGVKEDKKVFLDFYQAHEKIARVPAMETKYDFNQDEVNFAKILDYNENRVKLIFGSIDFNAWTLLRIVN